VNNPRPPHSSILHNWDAQWKERAWLDLVRYWGIRTLRAGWTVSEEEELEKLMNGAVQEFSASSVDVNNWRQQ